MTEGVIVWKAAQRKVKLECTADGRVDRRYTIVLYEAMMIGGNGGNSGGSAASDVEVGM